jgi:hypothetical protein
MGLLNDALDAAGGLDRWKELSRFTVYLSIKGELVDKNGKAGPPSEVVAQGCTRCQSLRLMGFIAPDKCCTYRPDRVAIENLDGTTLQDRNNPRAAFHSSPASWDDLDFAYFFGFSLWNYLTAPFLLALPGVETEELSIWRENGETWRRLAVAIPPRIVTHAPRQTFYFDGAGLQRRLDYDYNALGTNGPRVAQYFSAHHRFSGIVIPTLRRSTALRPDGSPAAKRADVDIEIFDASFE